MQSSCKEIFILATICFAGQIFATQTEVAVTSRLAEALCSYYENGGTTGRTAKVESLKKHLPNFDKDCFGYDQICPGDSVCQWSQNNCKDDDNDGNSSDAPGSNDVGSSSELESSEDFGVGLEIDGRGMARVLNGKESIPHIHPYIVSFHKDLETTATFHGVLFDAYSILVVKYHLDDALAKVGRNYTRLRIYSGKHNVFIYEKSQQARYMCSFTDHPQYNKQPGGACQHCYSIVHLSDPFNLNSLVARAKFGTPNETELMNDKCAFSGWGAFKDELKADRLRETFVAGIKCKEEFLNATYQFCKQASYCWGDEGGPLMCDSHHRIFLSAIASGTTGGSCAVGSLFLDVKFKGFLKWVTSACYRDKGYECKFANFPVWYGFNYPDPVLPSESPIHVCKRP